MSSFQLHHVPRGLAVAASALLRTGLVVAGLFIGIGLMAFAMIVATLLVFWALLRGRRPQPVRFARQAFRTPGSFPFRSAASPHRPPKGEVVDVEAHEVTPWRQR